MEFRDVASVLRIELSLTQAGFFSALHNANMSISCWEFGKKTPNQAMCILALEYKLSSWRDNKFQKGLSKKLEKVV